MDYIIKALIIVDLQNDFCEGGPLQVQQASEIIPRINEIRKQFSNVFITQDWHPDDHISFHTSHLNQAPFTKIRINDSYEQELWPKHCVKDTYGSQLHKALKVEENDIIIKKGINSNIDSYSGFGENLQDSELYFKLKQLNVEQVYIVGLAYDYCVLETAIESFKLGFDTFIIEDLTKAIDLDSVMGKINKKLTQIWEQEGKLDLHKFHVIEYEDLEDYIYQVNQREDI